MEISDKALKQICEWEGFRAMPYDDGKGIMTIGYGHAIRKGETFSKLTKAQALEVMRKDVAEFVGYCNSYIKTRTKPTTQGQFDAVVSFCFNAGPGKLKKSDWYKAFISGDDDEAASLLAVWGVGEFEKFPGLAKRRSLEAEWLR
jgi:lysozyme